MSFPITSSDALRVTGLSQAISSFNGNGIFMAVWIKVTDSGGSDYLKTFQMYSDSAGSQPNMSVNYYPNRYPWCHMSRAGGSVFDIINTTDQGTNSGWSLVWANWNASNGDVTSGVGNVTGTTSSGPSDWVSLGGTIKAIGVGLWRSDDGTTDENVTQSCKLAMPMIVKRMATTGGSSDLSALVGGTHPLDVFGSSNVIDYWPLDSKTSGKNSWVLADTAGAITVDTGDNPSVSNPSGGGGGSSNFFTFHMV